MKLPLGYLGTNLFQSNLALDVSSHFPDVPLKMRLWKHSTKQNQVENKSKIIFFLSESNITYT